MTISSHSSYAVDRTVVYKVCNEGRFYLFFVRRMHATIGRIKVIAPRVFSTIHSSGCLFPREFIGQSPLFSDLGRPPPTICLSCKIVNHRDWPVQLPRRSCFVSDEMKMPSLVPSIQQVAQHLFRSRPSSRSPLQCILLQAIIDQCVEKYEELSVCDRKFGD